MLAEPMGGLEAETTQCVGQLVAQSLVVGYARPVPGPLVGYEPEGTCAPEGVGGSLGCGSWGSWGSTGLGAESHHVPH